MLAHIEHGLAYVLDADEVVDRSRLVGPMNVEVLGVRAASIRGPWCVGGGAGGASIRQCACDGRQKKPR